MKERTRARRRRKRESGKLIYAALTGHTIIISIHVNMKAVKMFRSGCLVCLPFPLATLPPFPCQSPLFPLRVSPIKTAWHFNPPPPPATYLPPRIFFDQFPPCAPSLLCVLSSQTLTPLPSCPAPLRGKESVTPRTGEDSLGRRRPLVESET